MAISMFEVNPRYIRESDDMQLIINILAQIDNYRCNPKTDEHFKRICSAIITNAHMHELFDKFENKNKNVVMKLATRFNNLTPYALNNVNLFKLLHKMNMLHLIEITGENLMKSTCSLTAIYIWENGLFDFKNSDAKNENKNATSVVENGIPCSSME